jgi:hypothetical protein
LVPAGIIVGRKNKNEKIKNLTIFASIMALTYLLLISIAKTKLPWYTVPMYPFLALLVGVFIFNIFSILINKENLKFKMLPYIFLILVFIAPYTAVILKIYQQQKATWKKDYNGVCYYLREIKNDKIKNDNFTILFDGIFWHGKFYLDPLQKQGKNIVLKNPDEKFIAGEVVLFSQSEMKHLIEENYETNVLEEFQITGLYEIVGEKEY